MPHQSCSALCRLAIDSLDLAGRLCSAVFKGDVVLLQRLLKAGGPPNTADYDGRTALHVAAAEGHMGAVSFRNAASSDMTCEVCRLEPPIALHVAAAEGTGGAR